MNASDMTPAAGEQHEHPTPLPADHAAQERTDQAASDRTASDQATSDQTTFGQTASSQGTSSQTASSQGTSGQASYDYRHGDAPLYRPYEGRMVAGVAAGIAQYLGVDPTIVRIVLAVLTVVGGAGIPVYVAGWLLMPDEGAPQSLASEFIGSFQGRSC
ncbi:MAG TPA: PspC domain-containing protein [Streptosporangiaceae bacterium]|nr:PspC domain-containing protein [Streptosporangiaceae bacterium]